MADTLRTFIALPVPDRVTEFLKAIQQRLRPMMTDIRWIPAANIHLTVKFLGNSDPSMVPAISGCLDAVARSIAPFTLSAKGCGTFPNRRQAKVLWVGLTGDLNQLASLYHNLELTLVALGFKRERRPFRAHLTLGRARRRPDPKLLDALLEPLKEAASEPFGVNQIRLYRSVLKPTGADYTLLHTADLAGVGR